MPLYNTTMRTDGEDARRRAIMQREAHRHLSLPGGEINRMDFRATLARVTCPTLILAGAEDPIAPAHLSREQLTHINEMAANLLILEACGHGEFRDRAVGFRRHPVICGGIVRSSVCGCRSPGIVNSSAAKELFPPEAHVVGRIHTHVAYNQGVLLRTIWSLLPSDLAKAER